MSEQGNSRSASKSFLGRRRSSQLGDAKDQRRSIFKKKSSTASHPEEQVTRSTYPIDIDAQMAAIKEQLNGLRLQRTDLQRRVEDINSTLNDIRGEYVTRLSLSGSTSDLSSIGSLASISDESSSLSSGMSRCCLLEEDCESSGIEFDMEDDDCETEYASSSASYSSTGTVDLGFDEKEEEEEEEHPELLSVSQVAYL